MVEFFEALSREGEELISALDEEKCRVPWISRRARPEGVWMRQGYGLEVMGVSDEFGGWSGMDGMVSKERSRLKLVLFV